MQVHPIANRINHNFSVNSSKGNTSKQAFNGMYYDNPFDIEPAFEWDNAYIPESPYSPQRQAIESTYGKRMAELADLAENSEISQSEYEIRLNRLKREKANAIRNLRNFDELI